MKKNELIKALKEKKQFYQNKQYKYIREQKAYYRGIIEGINLCLSFIGVLEDVEPK